MRTPQGDSEAVLPRIEEQRNRELMHDGQCQQNMQDQPVGSRLHVHWAGRAVTLPDELEDQADRLCLDRVDG